MIPFPPDWTQHFGVELATAYPPKSGARFRFHERWQPQPSFAQIVERVLASDPDFRVHQLGEVVRVVTREGEYGAWVAIDGMRDGKEAMRCIGAVFLDHFAAVLECLALDPHHFAELRQTSFDLLRGAAFKLTGRLRPFLYAPPVDWQPIVSGASTTWYPLDFPKHLATIAVPHALPVETDADAVIHTAFAEAGAGLTVESSTRDAFTSANGIAGSYLQLQGMREGNPAKIYREIAMFVVAPYAYRLRLETASPDRLTEAREVFRAVAGSFRPLPSAEEMRLGRAFARPVNVFDHWAS